MTAGRAVTFGVLVVDDDAIVRTWVAATLDGTEFRIVGQAARASEALDLALRRAPDLFLIDHQLPDRTGIALLHELRSRGFDAPAIVMTAAPRRGLNDAARRAGAQGSVLKSTAPGTFVDALRAAAAGESHFVAAHPRADREVRLSPRERAILLQVSHGSTNTEIAATLGVSTETVKTILGRAFAKLGVRRRNEAVVAAQRLGLLDTWRHHP
jgi:DNA-binding NarL/FixJ family response regulator